MAVKYKVYHTDTNREMGAVKMFNVISSIFLICIGIMAFAQSLSFPPSARLMPSIYSIVLIILSLMLLFISLHRREKVDETEEVCEEWHRVVAVIAMIAVYFVMVNIVGFYIATIMYLFIFIARTRVTSIVATCLISLGTPAVIYLFFDRMLHIAVPMGYFFQ